MPKSKLSILSLPLSLVTLAICTSCATAPSRKIPPREAFLNHWKETGSKVKVLQVTSIQNGMYKGNGIVDGRPIEEFYEPDTGHFSADHPVQASKPEVDDKKMAYRDLVLELANELNLSIPNNSRIAVINLPSDDGKETKLSSNLASKLEMGLINAGRDVVDRAKINEVIKEHKFQQSQSALFDSGSLARLGQFAGANTVVTGSYHLSMPKMLTVTVKAISVETTRVIVVKEKEIPLDGAGSSNRDEIAELTRE